MKILDALRDDTLNLRVSAGNRWLVFDNELQLWVVYYRPMYARKTMTLYTGHDEGVAIAILTENQSES